MPSITRRGSLPPSGLANKIERYARTGKYSTGYGNAWIECSGDRLYVRGHKTKRLELANWQFKTRGRGHAKELLHYFETLIMNNSLPQIELYVESVHNRRFADFFRNRHGWIEVNGPSFTFSSSFK